MTVKARFILEAMGSPEELVKKTVKKMVDSIKQGFDVKETHIEKPKKTGKKFYTSFTEITIEFKNVQFLFEFITYYTPSIVEILGPYKLEISAGELENIANDIISKIHQFDKQLKSTISTNKLLTRKLRQKSNTK